MTLAELESISVITVSWVTIVSIIVTLVVKRGGGGASPTPAAVETSAGTWKSKYTIPLLIKWCRVYALSMLFFALMLVNFATNDRPVTALDVVSISACTGAIIFMIVGCAYKYILWQTARAFDTGRSR